MPRKQRRGRSAAGGLETARSSVERYYRDLIQQRDTLERQIAALRDALAAMGGAPAPARAARPAARVPRAAAGPKKFRPGSLKDFICKALSGGGVMAVKDITSSVLKLGYKTQNKTLAKSVGIALAEMKGAVRKLGRGKFKLA